MYANPRPPYPNELYHHGVLGMHWGIRRYQPYRKGDKVKGGKEIGKATKVEQRSIAQQLREKVSNVNKLTKEIHKGRLEKAAYKAELAKLKDARKEVRRTRRRQAEENIRERIREHREQAREDKRLEDERKERNLERAQNIVNGAAQIGTLLYGAYQLKKNLEANGTIPSSQNNASSSSTNPPTTPNSSTSSTTPPTTPPSGSGSVNALPSSITRSGSTQTHVGATHTLSTPSTPSSSSTTTPTSNPLNIHTNGSHSAPTVNPLNITRSGHDTSSTNRIHLNSASTTAASDAVQQASARAHENIAQRAIREARERKQQSRQRTQDVANALRSGQSRSENNSATLANANVNIMTAMEKLRGRIQNGTASDGDRRALRSLESLNSRYDNATRSMMDHAADLASVRMQNRGNLPGQHIGAASNRDDFNATFGNAVQRGAAKVKRFKNLMRSTDASQRADQESANQRFMAEMRRMQNTANAAKGINMNEADVIANATPDELIRRFAHYMKCRRQDELYHHGVLGMHWGIRRYQPYRKGERVKGGKEVGEATKVQQESDNPKDAKMTWEYPKNSKQKKEYLNRIEAARHAPTSIIRGTPQEKAYRDFEEKVRQGGVSKKVDLAMKKWQKALDRELSSKATNQAYVAERRAWNNMEQAIDDVCREHGYSLWSPKEISSRIKMSTSAYNDAQKRYSDATAKLDKMFNGNYKENFYKKEFRSLYNSEAARNLRGEQFHAEQQMAIAKDALDSWKKEPIGKT